MERRRPDVPADSRISQPADFRTPIDGDVPCTVVGAVVMAYSSHRPAATLPGLVD
ncbi:MAG: hypothetical protein VX897_00630 [Actinomycetota bacterium]|nr:hypothetical protein [Actinomycetota bacterium]